MSKWTNKLVNENYQKLPVEDTSVKLTDTPEYVNLPVDEINLVEIDSFWTDPKNADVIKKACAVYGVNENVCSRETKESITRFIIENIK